MTIEKCKDFVKDGYGTWDDTSKPTTYANMYDFMKNQNNVTLALAKGLWQPSTSYTVGTIIRSPNLPAGCVATCTAPGTSGTTEPKWTAYGTTVTDGACKWKVNYEGTNASASGGSGNVDMSNYVEKSDYQEAITSLQYSINTKQNTLTFDSTPTANSSNPVTSDGIKKAIDAKRVDLSNYYTKTQVDTAIANAGVSGGTVDLSAYVEKSDYQEEVVSLQDSINTKQDRLTFDTTPTAGSTNPVTSAGIKAAIDAKTVDLSNYYTKNQVDSAIASASGGADLSNYYTKAQVDTAIADAISAITDGDNKSY